MSDRRTVVDLLIDDCKRLFPGKSDWGTEASITEALCKDPTHQWNATRVSSALHRAMEDESIALVSGRGGHIIYGGSDGSLLLPAAKGILASWGRSNGWRFPLVIKTSNAHGGKNAGAWQHPDLIVFADPKRRSSTDAGRQLHAIEVEPAGGFDIKSIYQAFEQGRGADYCWVFSYGSQEDGTARRRIERAARELGVGWVEMIKWTAPSTWEIPVPAGLRASSRRSQAPSEEDRLALLETNGLRQAAMQRHWFHDRTAIGTFGF